MKSTLRPALAALLLLSASACAAPPVPAAPPGPPPVATFSIVARDPETGDLGVAVQSKFLGVGAVVPWARADVGAVATQAWANTRWGPEGLALLGKGLSAERTLDLLVERDPGRAWRQAGIVDASGRAASYTGEKALDWAGGVTGDGYACQGNILAGPEVAREMARGFESAEGPLAERLVAALAAGQAAGGDRRGRQSAALLVVRRGGGYSGFDDRMIDLRVDDHERPIEELGRLLALHRRVFGTAPLPGAADGLVAEPAGEPGSLATPRAAWDTWVARFRTGDREGLWRIQTVAFRRAHPFEEWRKDVEEHATETGSFLDRFTYAGTRIDGDEAVVGLTAPGSPRPVLIRFVREDGEWRMPD